MAAEDVRALVTELGLSQYVGKLAEHGLGTFETLNKATLDDLRKTIGMLPGHARLLHKKLAARQAPTATPPGAEAPAAAGAAVVQPGPPQAPSPGVHPTMSHMVQMQPMMGQPNQVMQMQMQTFAVPPQFSPGLPSSSMPRLATMAPMVPGVPVMQPVQLQAVPMQPQLPAATTAPPPPQEPQPEPQRAQEPPKNAQKQQQAQAQPQTVVDEALTFMKSIMGVTEEDDHRAPPTEQPASAFDAGELQRRIQAAQQRTPKPAAGGALASTQELPRSADRPEKRSVTSAFEPPTASRAPAAAVTKDVRTLTKTATRSRSRRRSKSRKRSRSRKRKKEPKAKLSLGQLLRDVGGGVAAQAADKAAVRPPKPAETDARTSAQKGLGCDAVPVEQRYVDSIFGPASDTLKVITRSTGLKISVDQETKDKGYSIVRISGSGSKENLLAKQLIEASIREFQANAVNGQKEDVNPSQVQAADPKLKAKAETLLKSKKR